MADPCCCVARLRHCTTYLDGDFGARWLRAVCRLQVRRVHLADRATRDGVRREAVEQLLQFFAQLITEDLPRPLERMHRRSVRQRAEGVAQVVLEDIVTC